MDLRMNNPYVGANRVEESNQIQEKPLLDLAQDFSIELPIIELNPITSVSRAIWKSVNYESQIHTVMEA